MQSKLSKAQATYTFHPDVEYTCVSCVFHKDVDPNKESAGALCVLFDPAERISEDAGACNYWTHGDDSKSFDVPIFALFTKVELGYEENAKGFGCKRCVHYSLSKQDCELVDKKSPGDTPGQIALMGCCSLWEPDPKRSKMTTGEILELAKDSPLTFEEYQQERRKR